MDGDCFAAGMVAVQGIDCRIGGPNDPFEKKQKPKNTGRRAEKNAAAMAKAASQTRPRGRKAPRQD